MKYLYVQKKRTSEKLLFLKRPKILSDSIIFRKCRARTLQPDSA
jgi:hypothetical protein